MVEIQNFVYFVKNEENLFGGYICSAGEKIKLIRISNVAFQILNY